MSYENTAEPRVLAPQGVGDWPPVAGRVGYDRAYRQRKRGIYVLAGVCVAFFVVVISACYIAAAKYGYGTGFGDGKELPARIPPLGGTGFWGDLGLLAGTVALDLVILFVWYLAASRMDNPSVDDPVAPDDGDVDLNDGASWYVVQVPTLTRLLMVVAISCLVGIVIGASAVIPVVAIRYGWVL
ncbi:hypothetical protein [Mycobacterium sp.]|uniref:hypothetical protein n=1 Tax=Mycobacterium sp. TaxID=1785 RepID=UPI003F973266